MALRLTKGTSKAVRAEGDIAATFARLLAHAELGVRGHAQMRGVFRLRGAVVEMGRVGGRVEDLLDGDFGEDLQVHQG